MAERETHPQAARRGRKTTVLKSARATLLSEEEALARVTWLYHHRNLTQEQISFELGLSRPTVARFLRVAAAKGLITVSLRLDVLRRMELSSELAARFNLREVFIVPTAEQDSEADILRGVGKTGALYLETVLKPHHILAIAWGRTMLEVGRALTVKPIPGLVVAQSFGGLNSGESFSPSQVTSLVGEKLRARVYHLYVPAMVASKELRDILLADAGIRAVLDVARQAACFMAGIGKVATSATVVQTGFLDLATIDRLRARGAVGDISARYFDIDGKRVLGDVEDRTMGLSWEDLEGLANVVTVASGVDKTEAIIGALRTGIPDVLIVDDCTARSVLDFDARQPQQT